MQRIIAVNTNCYHGYSIEEALKGIAACGFHYVELTATRGWTEHVMPEMSFKKLYGIRQAMQDLGLSAIGTSGHCNLMHEDRLKDFVDNIHLAAFFGSKFIVTSTGEAHFQKKENSPTELLVSNIKRLVPELKKNSMKLVLELHGQHATGADMKKIVDAVGSPLVGINYDTGNAVFYADADPVQDLAACVDQVLYMHIKDKSGENREWNFPALGKGKIDFRGIFAQLDKAGNRCPLSLEIEFTKEGSKNIDEVNRAVSDSSHYLKSLGYEI